MPSLRDVAVAAKARVQALPSLAERFNDSNSFNVAEADPTDLRHEANMQISVEGTGRPHAASGVRIVTGSLRVTCSIRLLQDERKTGDQLLTSAQRGLYALLSTIEGAMANSYLNGTLLTPLIVNNNPPAVVVPLEQARGYITGAVVFDFSIAEDWTIPQVKDDGTTIDNGTELAED